MVAGSLAPMMDAHVHLPAYADAAGVVASARARGMRLVSVSTTAAEAAPNLRLRDEDPSTVRCFFGVHPSEAVAARGDLEELAPLWERADGVGEVGLDP